MFTPWSIQISTRRCACATSLLPVALKNAFPPPNVIVPRQSTGTLSPDLPSWRCSIAFSQTDGFEKDLQRRIGVLQRHRNSRCKSLKVSASSNCGQWPHRSITVNREPPIIEEIRFPSETSAVGSCDVQRTSVGDFIRP